MEGWPVNITDLAVLVTLVLSGLLAFSRGLVHEVLSMASWIGAVFASIYGYPYLRPYARDLIDLEIAADIAAGAVAFILTLVVLTIVSKTVSSHVQDSALNALDRSLGFIFGLGRGAVIVCLVYLAVEWLVPRSQYPAWVAEARTLPIIEQGALWLKAVMPDDSLAESSKRKVKEASDTARKAYDIQKAYEKMVTPTPKTDPNPTKDEAVGYKKEDTRQMDRLIQSVTPSTN